MSALLQPKGGEWVVYELTGSGMWAATVQFGKRINGEDGVSVYDFESRVQAVDWCLDMVAMRDLLDAWKAAV